VDERLIVPVRECAGGVVSVRTARADSGERVGLAFTSEARLRAALGDGQRWIAMAEPALRSMLRPLAVTRIQTDPVLVSRSRRVAA